MLVRALTILNWHTPISAETNPEVRDADRKFLDYLTFDPYPDWTSFFDDEQLRNAIDGIKSLLGPLSYPTIDPSLLVKLVKRLEKALPPIVDDFDDNDSPRLRKIDFRHILHAGWVYWIGCPRKMPEPFFNTNRLCNQALVQQCAISEMIGTAS